MRRRNWHEVVQGASREEAYAVPRPEPAKKARPSDHDEFNTELKLAADKKRVHPDPQGWAYEVRKTPDRHQLSQQRVDQLERLFGKYRRPSPEAFLKQEQCEFYLQDLDYVPSNRFSKYSAATLRLACLTPEGHKACVRVVGFLPYFYVKPNRSLQALLDVDPVRGVREFQQWLEKRIVTQLPSGDTPPLHSVCSVELIKRFPFYGYRCDSI
jgi:hypothetical protein